MEYRVDEVGALIFKPRDSDNKQDLSEVLGEIKSLKDSINKLNEENRKLKKEIEEIKKGIALWVIPFFSGQVIICEN